MAHQPGPSFDSNRDGVAAKMRRRGNISLKLLAQLMVKGGFDHIITVDLHSKESLGFFDCAVDNLRASPFLIQYIQDCVSIAFSLNSFINNILISHQLFR